MKCQILRYICQERDGYYGWYFGSLFCSVKAAKKWLGIKNPDNSKWFRHNNINHKIMF